MKAILFFILFLATFNITAQSNQDSTIQYYDLLTSALNTGITQFNFEPVMLVQFPSQGCLKWYYQNNNDLFNHGTFDMISARVKPSAISDFLVEFSGSGGFPNAYSLTLMNIYYAQSPSSKGLVKKVKRKSVAKSRELIHAYQKKFGKISQKRMEIASKLIHRKIATKIDYIIDYELSHNWNGSNVTEQRGLSYAEMEATPNLIDLLKYEPENSSSIITLAQSYLKMNSSINALLDSVSEGNWILNQLRDNCTEPTAENGGMKTINPNTGAKSEGCQVGYGIANRISEISESLKIDRKNVKISVIVDKPNPILVTVISETPNRIDTINYQLADSIVEIELPFQTSTLSKGEVQTEYFGIVDFEVQQDNWNIEEITGWYWGYPITQAVANIEHNKGGYTFIIKPQFNFDSLRHGGNFGFIKSLLICDSSVSSILVYELVQSKSDSTGSFLGSIAGMGKSKGEVSSTLFREELYPRIEIPTMQQAANIIGGRFLFPGVPCTVPTE